MNSMTSSEAIKILLTPEKIQECGGILETLKWYEAHKMEVPIDEFRAYMVVKRDYQKMFATVGDE